MSNRSELRTKSTYPRPGAYLRTRALCDVVATVPGADTDSHPDTDAGLHPYNEEFREGHHEGDQQDPR